MTPGTANSLKQRMLKILGRAPVFEQLQPDELEVLSKSSNIHSFGQNALIVSAGSAGDSMMVILEGLVKVELQTADGREIILSHLYPGDFFGEMSLIDPAPRSASVITVERTTIATLTRSAFVEIVRSNPDVLMKMAATICRRLRRTNEKIADIVFMGVSGRVAKYLIELAERDGLSEPSKSDSVRVKIPSHKEIAAQLGTTRETVSRVFAHFRRADFIRGENKCWLINRDKLNRLI